MNKPFYDYLPADMFEQALAAGVVDEAGNISREYCNCNAKMWGRFGHSESCPIWQYYVIGGVYATDVVEAIMNGGDVE